MDKQAPSFPVRQIFFLLLLTFGGYILVDTLWPGDGESKTRILLLECMTVVPALVLVRLKKIPFRQTFRLHPVSARLLGLSLVIGAGLNIVTDALNRLILYLLPMPQDLLDLFESVFVCKSVPDILILFAGAVVIAALAEEMLFRGLIQGTFEAMTDITRAVMTTAVVFTILHFNPWQAVPILILGVALGILTWRCGSIYPAVIVHGMVNLLSVLSINISESFLKTVFYRSWTAPLWILAGCAAAVWGFRQFYKWTK